MADETKPQGDPASLGIPPLVAHLETIASDPSTALEPVLFEKVLTELSFFSLPFADNTQAYHALLTRLIAALPLLADDASVRTVTSLIDALIARMPIRAVLSFIPAEMLVAALQAEHPAANLLAMDIVKRAEGPEGRAAVARSDVLDALVTRWMHAPAVEVGQRGEEAVTNLLEGPLGGLVVATSRLSINEPEVNGDARELNLKSYLTSGPGAHIIVEACTVDAPRQSSLSQNRLLSLVPKIARADLTSLLAAELPISARPILARLGIAAPGCLFDFAVDVVDKGDIAMYLVLVEFWKDLFRECHRGGDAGSRAAFVDIVSVRKGETVVARAVAELEREVQADEDLAEFGEWLRGVLEAVRSREA